MSVKILNFDGYMSKFIEVYTKICAFYCVYFNQKLDMLKNLKIDVGLA